MIEGPRSLTFHWCTYSWWGRERLAWFFAYEVWLHFHDVYSIPNHIVISWLTGPKIIEALLTIIFKMGQGVSCFVFWLWRVAKLTLCVFVTKSHFNFPTYRTKNCWRSVDAHFQDGAGSILLSFLRIIVGYTVVMYNRYKITSQLPD